MLLNQIHTVPVLPSRTLAKYVGLASPGPVAIESEIRRAISLPVIGQLLMHATNVIAWSKIGSTVDGLREAPMPAIGRLGGALLDASRR